MTPPPEGTPWWAWLLAVGIVALLGMLGLVLAAWIRSGRRLKRVDHQVSNEHDTNLRDDVDLILGALERVEGGQKRHDSEIRGLRHDIRQDRDDVHQVSERLDGHMAETRREHTATSRRLDLHLDQSAPILRWVEQQMTD